MEKRNKKNSATTAMGFLAISIALVVALSACSPGTASSSSSGIQVPESNDVVVFEKLPAYELQESTGSAETGIEMTIDEESALQQEKTTGGAGGAVTSRNIQPLEPGITGYPGDSNPPGFTASPEGTLVVP
ncbi:MAG: hypothetical protein LBK67_12080 [Coriobacteriales bacterium]|nr:hypothetical protein [Coriobacteriales bacterium]